MSDELLTFDPRGDATDAMLQKMIWQQIGLAMPVLARLDLKAVADCVSWAHTVGWFMDPTAYLDALDRGDMDDMAELARLLIPAVEHWNEKIVPKLGEQS